MDGLWFFVPLYVLSYIPVWFWLSTLITAVHTAEEANGEIWRELNVPAVLYFGFQLAVAVLGWFCIVEQRFVVVFLAIRIGDAVVTHWILRKPGVWTSPLLILDAVVVIVSLGWVSPSHQFSNPTLLSERGLVSVATIQSRQSLVVSCPSLNPHKARVSLCGQNAVGQSLTDDGFQHALKSQSVANIAVIESERLLIGVSLQMERSDRNAGPFNRSLEQRPEVFESVGVNSTSDVAGNVVNRGMKIPTYQSGIGRGRIGVEIGLAVNVTHDVGQQRQIIGSRHNERPDLANRFWRVPLEQTLDDSLTNRPASGDRSGPLFGVHVGGSATDESFVAFNLTPQLAEGSRFHRQADSMKHEPSGFLSDAQRAAKFQAANPVLGVGNAPDSDEPFIEAKRGILKDRLDLDAELLPAAGRFALEHRPRSDDADLIAATFGAADFAIGPFDGQHRLETNLGIAVVTDGFKQCFWCIHTPIITGISDESSI